MSCARASVVAVKVHAELFAAALSKRAIMEAWEGVSQSAGSKASLAEVGLMAPSHERGFQKSSRALALSACSSNADQRRGDVEIRNYLRDQAGSRSLVFDLSIAHDRFGSSSHVQQNGCLSHPQDLDAPLRIAAQRC